VIDDQLQNLLRELESFGSTNDVRATERHEKMLNITPETGEMLSILVQSSNARRVLEIGTSNGYSTLWLADAVKAISGYVITVEVSAVKAEMARSNLERSGLSTWVRQSVMDAGQFFAQQPESRFDLLFLDADRQQYATWWPWIQNILAPGGLLVADNAVSHAAEMNGFLADVRAQGWRSVVVPIGNGELVALKPR